MSEFRLLEVIALKRDLPEHDLKVGDAGTIVELLGSDGVLVEFVEASGDTRAVVGLAVADIRKVKPHEMLSVRS